MTLTINSNLVQSLSQLQALQSMGTDGAGSDSSQSSLLDSNNTFSTLISSLLGSNSSESALTNTNSEQGTNPLSDLLSDDGSQSGLPGALSSLISGNSSIDPSLLVNLLIGQSEIGDLASLDSTDSTDSDTSSDSDPLSGLSGSSDSSDLSSLSSLLGLSGSTGLSSLLGSSDLSGLSGSSNSLESNPLSTLSDLESLAGSGTSSLNSTGVNKSTAYNTIISKAASTYNVDPNLIRSVIQQESGYNNAAVSASGAIGLMQLMPSTASSLGVTDPTDPAQNIMGGTKYISELLNKYNGNKTLALAAYNAGPAAVDRYEGVPPYNETTNYVKSVLQNYYSL